jgi:hypothetical protein
VSNRKQANARVAEPKVIPFSGEDCSSCRLRERLSLAGIIRGGEKPPTVAACDLLVQYILDTRYRVDRRVQLFGPTWLNAQHERYELITPAMDALVAAVRALETHIQHIRLRQPCMHDREFGTAMKHAQAAHAEFREAASALLARVGYVQHLFAIGQADEAEAVRKIVLARDRPCDEDIPSPYLFTYEHWHDYVGRLAEAFRAAMLTTNRKAPQYGDHNSLSRFLADVIPFISSNSLSGVEAPSEKTIMRFLQRTRDQEGGE